MAYILDVPEHWQVTGVVGVAPIAGGTEPGDRMSVDLRNNESNEACTIVGESGSARRPAAPNASIVRHVDGAQVDVTLDETPETATATIAHPSQTDTVTVARSSAELGLGPAAYLWSPTETSN